jgi:vitamin B12 transporter
MHVLRLAASAALAVASLPGMARAEDKDGVIVADLRAETIVVTGTRAPARAETLPAEISVIDIDTARDNGVATLAETLRQAPGLDVTASGGAGQQTSLFLGGANSNHTLVLYDGLRINDPSTPGSSYDAGEDTTADLGRIEIVSGPMSAVYGSDAIGGVVNLIPRHGGPGPFNMRLDIGAGSLSTLNAAVGADGALGRFRYAVTGEGFATSGYDLVPKRMSTYTGEADGARTSTVSGVFDYAVNEVLALDLLVRQRRAQADFDAFVDLFPLPERREEDSTLQISHNDLTLARLGATWTIADGLSLRATDGGLRQQRVQSDFGEDTDRFRGARRFSDLTLTWRHSDALSIVGGVSGERDQVNIAQGFGFAPPFFFTSAKQSSVGAFVTAQAAIEGLTLTGALRGDRYDGFGAHATWRAGASYALSNSARVYAAYGTAFRAPTLYERFVSFGDPGLDPERSQSWEAGADAHLAMFGQGRGVELAGLYRHTDIRDLIDFGPLFSYANVERAKIDSAELRLALRPLPWLTARLAYIYTDARDGLTGASLLRRPKHVWTGELEAAKGRFRADLSWREVGDRQDTLYGDDGFETGVGTAPSYDVVRLSLGYRFDAHAEIYIAADNLADATYEPVNAFAGAPRTVMMGVRLKAGT